MDCLFKALPTELQWEILCVFVGSHVVRNNKLIRRLNGKIQKEILANPIEYSESRRLHLKYHPIFNPEKIPWVGKYCTVAIINFSEGGKRILMENTELGQLSYWYICNDKWVVSIMDDLTLPPFVKHSYPSWESTDKKKGVIWQKVVLYDPRRNNTEYYGYGADWYNEFD